MRLLFFFALAAVTATGCGGGSDGGSPTAPSANVAYSTTDLRPGTGTEATAGRNVTVNYTLWIFNSAAVDNKGTRVESGTFGPFVAGGNQAIEGFSRGVVGMRVGGLRRVVVPPNLGYGNNPPPGGVIRANETLIFEIELLTVQ